MARNEVPVHVWRLGWISLEANTMRVIVHVGRHLRAGIYTRLGESLYMFAVYAGLRKFTHETWCAASPSAGLPVSVCWWYDTFVTCYIYSRCIWFKLSFSMSDYLYMQRLQLCRLSMLRASICSIKFHHLVGSIIGNPYLALCIWIFETHGLSKFICCKISRRLRTSKACMPCINQEKKHGHPADFHVNKSGSPPTSVGIMYRWV